jgi:hypothetical protein
MLKASNENLNYRYLTNYNSKAATPMREGDAFRNFRKINCRTDSLGLNLTCQGLLLGMRAEGPERFHQHHRTYWASEILTHRVTFILDVFP